MVYERDYVFISSTFHVCLRNPFINAVAQEKSMDMILKGLLIRVFKKEI